MTLILRDVPVLGGPSDLSLPDGSPLLDPIGRRIRAGSNQFIFWASFIPEGQPAIPSSTRRFAVVVDSGFGDTLLIREEQLEPLVGIDYRLLEKSRDAAGNPLHVRVPGGRLLTKFRVNLLLYPNLPGFRDRPDTTATPVPLRFASGILVWPTRSATVGRVRLPLLGMRGLHEIGATVTIDGPRGVGQMSI